MSNSGGGDRHRLDLRVVDQLRPVGVAADIRAGPRNSFPCAFPDVCDSHNIEPWIPGKRAKEVLAPVAVTTKPYFNDPQTFCLILPDPASPNGLSFPGVSALMTARRMFLHGSCQLINTNGYHRFN